MNNQSGGHNKNRSAVSASLTALFMICALSIGATRSQAQEGQPIFPPLPVNPAPLVELIGDKERKELAKADKPSEMVETYMDISDAHLDAAFDAIKTGNARSAEIELDIYNKALSEAASVAFAHTKDKDRRKLSKKIEQRLYKQIRTLEMIERLFPEERLAFAVAALNNSKRLRIQALNETFDSGDILDVPGKGKKQKKGSPEKSGSPPASIVKNFAPAALMRMSEQIPGDYLNMEEDDLVRLAQKIDDRIKVFMKIADRRLTAIKGVSAPADDKKAQKKAEEEEREWGPLPKLERYELLRHYARAIEESIAKLEDAHERNPKSSDIPRALKVLRDSTDDHLTILRSLEKEMKDEREATALKIAIDQAEIANQGAREGLKGN